MSEKITVVFLKNSTPYVKGDVTSLPVEEAEEKCKAGIVEIGDVPEGTGKAPVEEAKKSSKKSK